MKVPILNINITQNILEQFAAQLKIPIVKQSATLDQNWGEGKINFFKITSELELYTFQYQLLKPLGIQSLNPKDSDWLLLNINLSNQANVKEVNATTVSIQKFLPSGILVYTPQTAVKSITPVNESFEIVLLRFHRSLLKQYDLDSPFFENTSQAVLYEDLDASSEQFLQEAIAPNCDKLLRHALVLKFLSTFVKKLQARESESLYQNLHEADLKGLFLASAKLRNPLASNVPSIESLSKIAGMSPTKFKTCFKQVFGSPPIQYRQKIRMDYARRELEDGEKSASTLSYELGYSHPSKFTNAFKKTFGLLPSEL